MIPKNSISMRGTIDRCWLVALRANPVKVREVLPTPLEPILYGGHAYLGIVVSHLSHMRPAPLPAWTGLSYWHAAYRIYARLSPPGRPPIEGLWFLRSDADSALMTCAGNLLTDFRFHRSQILAKADRDLISLEVRSPDAPLKIVLSDEATLPSGSPFADLNAAAKALEYAPAGLSVQGENGLVMRIGRDEAAWKYKRKGVVSLEAPLLSPFEAVPEVAYEVEPIEYQWNRAERIRMDV